MRKLFSVNVSENARMMYVLNLLLLGFFRWLSMTKFGLSLGAKSQNFHRSIGSGPVCFADQCLGTWCSIDLQGQIFDVRMNQKRSITKFLTVHTSET